MSRIRRQTKVIQAEGAAGSATGSAQFRLGDVHQVYAVRLDYTNAPATTDVTIEDDNGGPILTVANANADGFFYPRRAAPKTDGSASTLTEVTPLATEVDVAVASADDNTEVRVTVFTRA